MEKRTYNEAADRTLGKTIADAYRAFDGAIEVVSKLFDEAIEVVSKLRDEAIEASYVMFDESLDDSNKALNRSD